MDNIRDLNQRWRYVALVAGLFITGLVVYVYWCWGPPTTLLLVRHADREGKTDAISAPLGKDRAEELRHVMEKSGIVAIYTSDAVRTQQTAVPTATALGLTPMTIGASDIVALADHIRNHYSGQKILIVGHSDSVPRVIAEFGGPAVSIPETEFDNLYVLTLCRCRWLKGIVLTNLQYGAISP